MSCHTAQTHISLPPAIVPVQVKSVPVSGSLRRTVLRSAICFSPRQRQMTQCSATATKPFASSQVRETLLRPDIDDPNGIRGRFETIIRDAQDSICHAIEEVDGTPFRQDTWKREGGGGGVTRVLQNGNVWEKAGVNVSVVYGTMPVAAYRAAAGRDLSGIDQDSRIPFFAAGISSVMHPHNPHAPTMHFNYRYFETEDWNGIPGQWWFGGGTDITPNYVVAEDMQHFHGTLKSMCDAHDPTFYPRFKKWCDEYFYIKHRGETRGLGGIFFDDLNDRPKDQLLAFSKDALAAVSEAYVPIIQKHKDDAFDAKQREWQQVRRGRYVEFNLVYDRGTTFGLKTGGRTESILMSLPVTATWLYDYQPEEGSPEARLVECTRQPQEWA